MTITDRKTEPSNKNRKGTVSRFPLDLEYKGNTVVLYTTNKNNFILKDHHGELIPRDDALNALQRFVKLDSIMGENFKHYKTSSKRSIEDFLKLKQRVKKLKRYVNLDGNDKNLEKITVDRLSAILDDQRELQRLSLKMTKIIKEIQYTKIVREENVKELIEINTKCNYILLNQARELYKLLRYLKKIKLLIDQSSFKSRLHFNTIKLVLTMQKFLKSKVRKKNLLIFKDFSRQIYNEEELTDYVNSLSLEDIRNKLEEDFKGAFEIHYESLLIN